jgi:hypothetical protein
VTQLRPPPIEVPPPAGSPPSFAEGFWPVAIAAAYAALVFVLLTLATGCVTRTTVCVQADHAVGRASPGEWRPASAGASVCADIERP